MTEFEKFAKAFEMWERDYRINPDKYIPPEESKMLGVSELSKDRASYFQNLLNSM